MKKFLSWLTVGSLLTTLLSAGCNTADDDDFEIITKPVIKFETGTDASAVKAVITSDIDLKSVVVTTSWGSGADAGSETVATITSFADPHSYVYEKSFTAPQGYLEMTVSVKAENTRNLSTTVSTKVKGEVVITMDDVIDALSAAYEEWERTGSMPDKISIQGFSFPKVQYFEYAAQTFFNLYAGKSNNPVVTGTYLDAEDNTVADTFAQEEISKELLNNALTRIVNYAATNGRYPNYASYPGTYEDPAGIVYEGNFTFRRAVVCVARILDAYKETNQLPATLSAEYQNLTPYEPGVVGTFTKSALVDALAAAYAEWESAGAMPESITVDAATLDKVQYFHAAIRVLLNARASDDSDIEVLTYLMPGNPSRDTYDKETVNVFNGAASGSDTEDLANIAQRMLDYAGSMTAGNGLFPNSVSFARQDDSVEFSFNRALVSFARAVAGFKTDSSWPESVSTEYLTAASATLRDFAGQFIGILTVWENTTGDIQVTDGDKFEDVRYVPADTKITVNGVEYDKTSMYEIAIRGLKALAEQNATLDAALPAITTYPWAANPYNEGQGNGGPLTPEEATLEFLLNYAGRQLTWAGNNNVWSNFCGYTGNQVAGYGGVCCLERNLLTMARFYKYLLDNNISNNIATACADVKFDATLY